MRDPLWGCDEHLGRDADFPALRGHAGARVPTRANAGTRREFGEDQGATRLVGETCSWLNPIHGASAARCCVRMGPPSRER